MTSAAAPERLPGKQAPVVLSVRGVKKTIRGKPIIKGVSFDVREGEIFGFLGPNGSGKTTTIRMLVDLIRPTEGTITICGCDVQRQPDVALRYVGCIVENPELYSYLTGWENLEHFARMLPGVGQDRIREVAAIVGMDQRIHDKVRTYSLGMRQRLGIAQALLGRPKLLILDEPTNGLDPQGIKEMREFIQQLAEGGLSLFVSSHLLSEIQQMCDRVAIISHGEVIAVGDTDELVRQLGGLAVWRADPVRQAAAILRDGGIEVLDVSDAATGQADGDAHYVGSVTVRMEPQDAPELTRRLVEAGVAVYGIEMKHATLEDLFLSLTAGERIE
ncbi:ABC transporter ATP-binding protein [Gordoniibacillus kamchatkensis]|uniref:ABC transporter ATP-binding protein n=1 Tax=Gordoniibacillus kamchatkensis TaxID=1590651 RepID=A0ABR5AG75_9BACL|nr:ABC transporter ATP-binding protein [Paenibacillus sp. VKM B-2647]KIL40063.1 ABC transporter ATP-binding protein [Paenibacillus sp. VKM B-2647]